MQSCWSCVALSIALHVQAVYANYGQPSSSMVADFWEIKVVNMFVLYNSLQACKHVHWD